MFEKLTLNQLYEMRTALLNHFDSEYGAYSEQLQKLETGSEEMTETINKWAERRDDIKAAQQAVIDEIYNREAKACPRAKRIHRAE